MPQTLTENRTTDRSPRDAMRAIDANLKQIIRGKDEAIELVLIALASGGHVLLEDAPGTGKTTLAKALAASMDGIFRRVQFTPDLLPADITGSSFYNPADGSFEFRPGPVFANVLLADEINRTSPRTQSALLEVMSEKPGLDRRLAPRFARAVFRGRHTKPVRLRRDLSPPRSAVGQVYDSRFAGLSRRGLGTRNPERAEKSSSARRLATRRFARRDQRHRRRSSRGSIR